MSHLLRINKLITVGDKYKRTFTFDDRLNIIRGDGYSGKSLILNLIDYCLGTRKGNIDLKVQKELDEYSDVCFLEISINNKVFTFSRGLKHRTNEIRIFLCSFVEHEEYSPWKKTPNEACDFLAEELGISFHTVLKRVAKSSDLTEEKISLRDLMRFLYIEQGELGTNFFMSFNDQNVNRKNKEIFKILNDLIKPDVSEIESELKEKKNEHNKLEKRNTGLLDYLANRDAFELVKLESERRNLSNAIEKETSRKKAIINNITARNSNVFENLKSDYNESSNRLNELEKQKQTLLIAIRNKELLLNDYSEELRRLTSTIEAMKKLKIEEHKNTCPLCDSLLEVSNESGHTKEETEEIEYAHDEIKKKMTALQKVIETEKQNVHEIRREIDKINEKARIYSNAMSEYQSNIDNQILAEIEAINSVIRDLQNEKNKISSLCDVHNEVSNNAGKIVRLDKEIKELEKRKEELNKLSNDEEALLAKIDNTYRKTLLRFKFDNVNKEETYISTTTYMPYYSGADVTKHTSGCLLLCMQIAYLGALLDVSKDDIMRFCHPRLLMLDTISNNIGTNKDDEDSVDPQTYSEIYNYIIELSQSTQIFIIDNTPPAIDAPHKEFILHRDNLRGFVNLEVNEYKPEEIVN